uniref:Uncharacterized protein n=1 Tax=Solanum lycopersicum TaxID=4081 RepID=A0A494G8Y5_SOLLC
MRKMRSSAQPIQGAWARKPALLNKEGEGVFLSSRHTVRLKALRRGGGAVIYVITVFVGRCSGRALSFLCPIPSYQTRLTSYQPAKGCEAGPGTRNESISVHGSCWPAAAQLFERNAVVLVPIRQRFIQLNPHSKEDHKLGARRNRKFQHVENGVSSERKSPAFISE